MSATDQQVLDAIKCVELHHFGGTSLVACCLTTTDGRFVLGTAGAAPGEPFEIATVAQQARADANAKLAEMLAPVAERSC